MIPDDPKAHAFEVSFADLHNHAATFHTFKLIMRTLGQTMPKQPPWNGYYLQQHAFQDQEEAGHNGSLYPCQKYQWLFASFVLFGFLPRNTTTWHKGSTLSTK